MTDAWSWAYDPDSEHVIGGLPQHVRAEVERLASQLATLGELAASVGRGPRPEGGLRTLDLFGGAGGYLFFLVDPAGRLVVIVRVVWLG